MDPSDPWSGGGALWTPQRVHPGAAGALGSPWEDPWVNRVDVDSRDVEDFYGKSTINGH